MAIENVVRPAQLPSVQPAKHVTSRRASRNWQPVILRFGVGGTFAISSASISQTVNYYAKRRPTEKTSGGSSLGFNDLNITFP